MIFQIEYKEFINQIQIWNIVNQTMTRIIMEETNNIVAFFLPLAHVTYVTVVNKSELSTADMLNFKSIAIRGRRFNEVERLRIEQLNPSSPTEDKKKISPPKPTEAAKPFFFESQFQQDVNKARDDKKNKPKK